MLINKKISKVFLKLEMFAQYSNLDEYGKIEEILISMEWKAFLEEADFSGISDESL